MSRSALVAQDALRSGGEMDQVTLLASCAARGLRWPGCNGGLFGGRSPWFEAREGRYYLSEHARRRLLGR